MSDSSKDHWYPVGLLSDIYTPRQTLLFGQEISLTHDDTGFVVKKSGGVSLPTIERFGHLWTSLGQPDHDLFVIPEANTPGRHLVDVGSVKVKCSPLRAVENFLGGLSAFITAYIYIFYLSEKPLDSYNLCCLLRTRTRARGYYKL